MCAEAETLICKVLGITEVRAFSSERCGPLWFLWRFYRSSCSDLSLQLKRKTRPLCCDVCMFAVPPESTPHSNNNSYCEAQSVGTTDLLFYFHFCGCFAWSLMKRKIRGGETWLGFEVISKTEHCRSDIQCSLNSCLYVIPCVTSYCITLRRHIKHINYNYTLSFNYCHEFYSPHYSNW